MVRGSFGTLQLENAAERGGGLIYSSDPKHETGKILKVVALVGCERLV
jgi:hypothetical protein